MKLLRDSFYVGMILALSIGLFLLWLWQPDRQVARHSGNLLRAVAANDWNRTTAFIADDYKDQWNNDRQRLIERAREVFAALGRIQLNASSAPTIERAGDVVHWSSRITISGQRNEMLYVVQERLNAVQTPFDLEWRHASAKPWDWKLVRVTNPGLALPEYSE